MDAYDRDMKTKIAHGIADDARQPDRSDHRHAQAASDVRQQGQRAVPQSVRECAAAGGGEARRDAGADRGGSAQLASHLRLRGEAGFHGDRASRSPWAPPKATTPKITSGLAPGDVVVMTGVDKLQEGSKVSAQISNGDKTRRRRAKPKRRSMSPSRIFILRPVATSLLMVGILLAGAVAYKQLPVSALPEVDYPTIQVITFYPGASPDVMASSVTAPLERQFGQVPGLQQMTSTSSDGSSVITLQFNLSLNIDVAEQEVQQSINASGTYLPPDLPTPPIYSKTNPADTPILTLALTSTDLPLSKVEDLADTRLAPKISQLPGVGLVSISGGQKPAVRIQANPTALASYGLNLEDLRSALVAANVNQAKGNFDGAASGVPDRRQRPVALQRRLRAADHRLSGTARRSS